MGFLDKFLQFLKGKPPENKIASEGSMNEPGEQGEFGVQEENQVPSGPTEAQPEAGESSSEEKTASSQEPLSSENELSQEVETEKKEDTPSEEPKGSESAEPTENAIPASENKPANSIEELEKKMPGPAPDIKVQEGGPAEEDKPQE